jgi:hypothetical protein
MPKVISKQNNTLKIFLDKQIDEVTTKKTTPTSPIKQLTPPLPPPSTQTEPSKITRKRKSTSLPEEQSITTSNPLPSQEPTPKQTKFTPEQQALYNQKKESMYI